MIEFIISFAIYWIIFSVGIMAGRKKGQMEEREACYKWIMRLNCKTLEDWQNENDSKTR